MMIVAAAEIQGLANNDVQVGKGLLTQDLVHEVQVRKAFEGLC